MTAGKSPSSKGGNSIIAHKRLGKRSIIASPSLSDTRQPANVDHLNLSKGLSQRRRTVQETVLYPERHNVTFGMPNEAIQSATTCICYGCWYNVHRPQPLFNDARCMCVYNVSIHMYACMYLCPYRRYP